ncbi:hypothetical protein [Rhizobium herbae]|uniref:DUF4190 domain-containing protein n=1 Tax=Rhizobium herbae TaxID=508661 RepID=A0ABS4ER90_9HYPH|nr:hypothetical protein [Rhizobium herbae]MBP1860448.1 hypothetical protein [Rhizobium herbae]
MAVHQNEVQTAASDHGKGSPRFVTLNQYQTAALKREFLLYGGCLLMFWLIGATSLSGFVITAFFVIMATAQFIKRAAHNAMAKMSKRSAFRRYGAGMVSLCFFCLMVARACYIATVLVDTELRTPAVPLIAASTGPS